MREFKIFVTPVFVHASAITEQEIVRADGCRQCLTGWCGTHFPTYFIIPVLVNASAITDIY